MRNRNSSSKKRREKNGKRKKEKRKTGENRKMDIYRTREKKRKG